MNDLQTLIGNVKRTLAYLMAPAPFAIGTRIEFEMELGGTARGVIVDINQRGTAFYVLITHGPRELGGVHMWIDAGKARLNVR